MHCLSQFRGELYDGHSHIDDAIKKGAFAILCEELPKNQVEGITYVQTFQSRSAYAVIASNYHNRPSAQTQSYRCNRNQWQNIDCSIIV